MAKGIVFDLEGTLIDSLGGELAAFNHALAAVGIPALSPKELLRHMAPGSGDIFAEIAGEKAEAAAEAWDHYRHTHLGERPLHVGILEVLNRLRDDGVPLAIFTGAGSKSTQHILDHHGLSGHFVTVIASDHVSSPKPSPEGLNLALSRMKVSPGEALYVGDSPADMLAAKLAGAQGVGALWDLMASREKLAAHQPRHWAEKPGDILRLLRS